MPEVTSRSVPSASHLKAKRSKLIAIISPCPHPLSYKSPCSIETVYYLPSSSLLKWKEEHSEKG